MKFTEEIILPSHILEEHIHISNKDMIDRILNGTYRNMRYTRFTQDIVTKFYSEDHARKMIRKMLDDHEKIIIDWLKFRYDKRIEITGYSMEEIGYGIAGHTNFANHYPMTGCRIVLELGYNGNQFEIITAYPVPSETVETVINRDRKIYRKGKKKS